MEVERVEPADTFALRREVLRPNQRPDEVPVVGEKDPSTTAFAVRDAPGGDVVSCALVLRAPLDPALERCCDPALTSWRLRAMATRADRRSSGLGSLVVSAILAHVTDAGGGVLWCHARTAATTFYARHGFQVVGEEFDEPPNGAHLVMWRVVEPGVGDVTHRSGVVGGDPGHA